MLTAIDHIIIGVHNLQQAAIQFSQKLGLAVSAGGIHSIGGTANRIIVIGDTYLELIAIHNPTEAQQSMLNRLAIHEGYLNFVLASNDIEADSNAMINRGIPILGPTPGSLRAADSRTRGWYPTNMDRPDLEQFGESVCRMTLAVENLDASRRYLDENDVTYTYQTMPHPVMWIHPDYACGASIVLHQDTE